MDEDQNGKEHKRSKQKTATNQNRTAVLFGNLEAYGMSTDGDLEKDTLQRGEGEYGGSADRA